MWGSSSGARSGPWWIVSAALLLGSGVTACLSSREKGHDWPGSDDCPNDGLDALRHSLRAVCSGTGNAEAGMPSAPSAIRKTVLLSDATVAHIAILSAGQEEWHRWSSCLPATWRPATIGDVELVACVGQQSQVDAPTCDYFLSVDDVKRTATMLPVALRDATTGAAVSVTVLRREPDDCPSSPDDEPDIVAPPIAVEDVEQWLQPLVQRR